MMVRRQRLTVVCLMVTGVFAAVQANAQAKSAKSNPILAATPPMGWNSWNFFAGKVTDKDIRDTADLLVSTGMRDAGYVYVNIDDTWEAKRDAQGRIQTNEKFPDMKALADYIHSNGLRAGLYSSPGPATCGGYTASYQYEEQDARQYADQRSNQAAEKAEIEIFGRQNDAEAGEKPAERFHALTSPMGRGAMSFPARYRTAKPRRRPTRMPAQPKTTNRIFRRRAAGLSW